MKNFHGIELTKEVRDFLSRILISIRKRLIDQRVDGFIFIKDSIISPEELIKQYILKSDEVYKILELHMYKIFWQLQHTERFAYGIRRVNGEWVIIVPMNIGEYIIELCLNDIY